MEIDEERESMSWGILSSSLGRGEEDDDVESGELMQFFFNDLNY